MRQLVPTVIYLDHAASSPLLPEAREAMLEWLGCANPSSPHQRGRAAREALEAARRVIAQRLGSDPEEVIFTSGATEANVLALTGLAQGRHVVTSAVEHPAVLEPLRAQGPLTVVECDARGLVDPEAVVRALRPDTALVSLMAANNEVGTLQPVAEVARAVRERGLLFHTDAVQAVAKLPVDFGDYDALSLSGHKFGGPQGTGALLVRSGLKLKPLLPGGGQEHGRRSGTPNVPGLVAMARALEVYRPPDPALGAWLSSSLGQHAHLTGHPELRLSGIVSCWFDQVGGEALVWLLEERGICASTGSACSSERSAPSHVLQAMGLSTSQARGSLRLSLGPHTTRDEVERAAAAVLEAVAELRRRAPCTPNR